MTTAVMARRTQAARTAATRARLLDATLECLDQLGYARTSTPEIARRAGLSRGAQLHHFPTKAELVASAVEHLFARRHDEFMQAFAALPPDVDRVTAAIDLLWPLVNGPTFRAWLELAVAARTDEELRTHLAAVSLRFSERVSQTFRELFAPARDPDAFHAVAPQFAFALLEGLAMQRLVLGDAQPAEPVLAALKALAQLAMAGGAPAVAAALGGSSPAPHRD